MRNPFQYGKVAERKNFIDRDKDRAFLKEALVSGLNVILMSPRRWGKSSLVKQAMKELIETEKDVRVCFIDAFPIKSSQEFYNIFAREVLRAAASHSQQILDIAGRFLRSIAPKISFSPEPMSEFSLKFEFSGNDQDVKEILNLPEKIAVEHNLQVIVCIDEFQKLAKLADYEQLESQMRSVWQHHQHTAYCLYGSQRHMMSDIFDSSEKPFYRFGQIYPLRKIKKEDWMKYIKQRFADTGKTINDKIAERIVDMADCHSWYVQQLASAVWSATDKTADDESFDYGFSWCVDVNSEAYRNICDNLSEAQVGLLRAISNGERQLTAADVLKKYRMGTSAAAVKNKKLLSELDIIETKSGNSDFLDPLFKVWFKEYF